MAEVSASLPARAWVGTPLPVRAVGLVRAPPRHVRGSTSTLSLAMLHRGHYCPPALRVREFRRLQWDRMVTMLEWVRARKEHSWENLGR